MDQESKRYEDLLNIAGTPILRAIEGNTEVEDLEPAKAKRMFSP